MQTTAGLWIDHRRAVIVIVSDTGEEITRITSSIEKQLRRSGRFSPRATYESGGAAGSNLRERQYRGQPADFYDEIIARFAPANTVLIFGPGEAKNELQKRIEKTSGAARIASLETVGEMTDDEIVEKVRNQFRAGNKSPAPGWDTTPPENIDCEG